MSLKSKDVSLIPRSMMSGLDIEYMVKKLKISYFRNVFARDCLPKHPHIRECGIVNLNKHNQSGSHWVCYAVGESHKIYFDSFGEPPPPELVKYLKKTQQFTYSSNSS